MSGQHLAVPAHRLRMASYLLGLIYSERPTIRATWYGAPGPQAVMLTPVLNKGNHDQPPDNTRWLTRTTTFINGNVKPNAYTNRNINSNVRSNPYTCLLIDDIISITSHTSGFTMDVISSTAFGMRVDSLRDKNNVFVTKAKKIFDIRTDKLNLKLMILGK